MNILLSYLKTTKQKQVMNHVHNSWDVLYYMKQASCSMIKSMAPVLNLSFMGLGRRRQYKCAIIDNIPEKS